MGNVRFTLEDAAVVQRHIRVQKSIADGMTVSKAYAIAEKLAGVGQQDLHPCGYYMNHLNMVTPIRNSTPRGGKPTPRRIVAEHREVLFNFSDGTTMRGCTATDCLWAKRNPDDRTTVVKKHSDGTPGSTLYSSAVLGDLVEDEPEVEEDDDGVTELHADEVVQSLIAQTDIEDDEAQDGDTEVEESNLVEEEYAG